MNLLSAISYICAHYPYPDDLSDARLNKTLYLADWKSCIQRGQQVTDLQWKFNHYGPYVDQILQEASANQNIEVLTSNNMYGSKKKVIRLRDKNITLDISHLDKTILDEVIRISSSLNFKELIDLVYSTYPVMSQPRNSILNLPLLAQKYQSLQQRAAS